MILIITLEKSERKAKGKSKMSQDLTRSFWKNVFGDSCKIYFKSQEAFTIQKYRKIKKQPDNGYSFHDYIWTNHCDAVYQNKQRGEYFLAKV